MDNQTLPIRQAADGDQEAFARVVHRMEPLIHDQIHSLHCDGIEDEDMIQEALVGLLAAVRTYRPDRGTAFTTYATTCIRHRLLDMVRRAGSRANREQPLSEDTKVADTVADPALQVQEQESLDGLLIRIQGRLTPMEYRVLLLRLGNNSYAEIARQMGVSKKAVDNAVQRLRRKFSSWQ